MQTRAPLLWSRSMRNSGGCNYLDLKLSVCCETVSSLCLPGPYFEYGAFKIIKCLDVIFIVTMKERGAESIDKTMNHQKTNYHWNNSLAKNSRFWSNYCTILGSLNTGQQIPGNDSLYIASRPSDMILGIDGPFIKGVILVLRLELAMTDPKSGHTSVTIISRLFIGMKKLDTI